MKKKIEIITMQRVPNYGSILQAYALQETIKNMGFESELINYFPERMTMKGMLKNIKNKKGILKKSLLVRTAVRAIMIPSYIKRFHSFNKFIFKNLNMTKKEYHTIDELKKYIPEADIYCTGSDQVWNSGWNDGIDYPLFLDFVEGDKKCISYAASFGKDKLDDWEIDETKKLLKKYKHISTRELSGKDILDGLGYESENVLDPTLLFNKDDWRKLETKKYQGKKYILVYNLNRNTKIDEYAQRIAKEKNLEIYYISYALHEFYKKGKMKCCTEIEDFIDMLLNATYVITDSFHATAFSINFNKEFMIVFPEKYSTRVRSILKLTGLENRIVNDINDISLADKKVDFSNANEIIKKEREKSINWLKNAIEN